MARGSMGISKAWAQAAALTFLLGFTGLDILAALPYSGKAPLPARVTAPTGESLFTRDDILAGQHVFQSEVYRPRRVARS